MDPNSNVSPLPSTSPSQTPQLTNTKYPAWRAYVHLYLPFLVSIPSIIIHSNEQPGLLIAAIAVLPTYLIGSYIYPPSRLPPSPTSPEAQRFSRKNDFYRIALLLTYGRLYGTPFNLQFFILDIVCSYLLDFIAEGRQGMLPRKSAFIPHLYWVAGNAVLMRLFPGWIDTLGSLDRTLYRAAYVALVDDIVGVLAYPNVRTKKGKLGVIMMQFFLICFVVSVCRIRLAEGLVVYPDAPPRQQDFESFMAKRRADRNMGIY